MQRRNEVEVEKETRKQEKGWDEEERVLGPRGRAKTGGTEKGKKVGRGGGGGGGGEEGC